MKKMLAILVGLLACFCCQKPVPNDLLEEMMLEHPEMFQRIINQKDSLEVQILYTQIDRDENNNPIFRSFSFNLDSSKYFYPASTVKLPLVLLSLEKLRELKVPDLDEHTPMFHDSLFSGQIPVLNDSTSENGLPSIAHYSKKILVVSDNDAYNRLFEFIGQEFIRTKLGEKGYSKIRVVHRLERPLSMDENRHTEAVKFLKEGRLIYRQPMLVNEKPVFSDEAILKGEGFIRNDSLIKKPFEFTFKNFYSLQDQQEILKSIIFPRHVPQKRLFKISDDDRAFVLQYLSQLPTETLFPAYHSDSTYYDAYCKFLMFGGQRGEIPPTIRIFNKVGDAYGYLIDNAYIVDFENNVEFMLSAVINTNTDGIYNDSKYEYETLGFPFMKDLGQLIYRHELKRERKFKPDLSEFKLSYDR